MAKQTPHSVPQIGIVGGGIRGSLFATAVQQHPEAELVALCDPAEKVQDQLAATLGIPTYASAEKMLADHPELTAAVIATPDFAHLCPALACLERGLDLLIEKPLATTSEEGWAIERAARQSGASVVVGFENRWNPQFAEVRKRIATGDHGRVVNQVVNLNDTVFVPTSMLSWADQSSPAWFLMPHSLDLAIWLSGAVPIEVFARGRRGSLSARGVDTWDAITASFRMSDDSLLVLNSQWVLPESSPSVFDFRYEINTSTTSFHLDISNSGVTQYGPEKTHWLQFGVTEHRGQLRGVPIDMMADFIASLNGADVDLPGVDQGCLVTDAISAVHTSLNGNEVRPISCSTSAT